MKNANWENISKFDGPQQSPGFLLWQVSMQWRRQIETVLAPLDLTHSQFVLLASLGWLTRDNQEISQIELARHCCMDITMTSQVLRTLEKKKYLTRYHSANDERSKFSQLTRQGVQLIEKAIPIVEKKLTSCFLLQR